MLKKNLTFRVGDPAWGNACVGENGDPGYAEYAKGFSVAANVLLEKVISQSNDVWIDDVIYPICFNMRHSVELRIKHAYEIVAKIAVLKKIKTPEYKSNHDIRSLWEGFKEYAISIDKNYKDIIIKLNQTILDISEVDPNGETFRYPKDKSSNKHLVDVGSISCHVLFHKFKELEYNFESFSWLNQGMLDEYSLLSFTKESSRGEIWAVAKSIGALRASGVASDKHIKERVIEEHSISGREYCKILVLIKGNYQFSASAGCKKEIMGITSEQLVSLVRSWLLVNEDNLHREPVKITDISRLILDDVELKSKGADIFSTLFEEITPEYLAGMHAIFYFARTLRFSEYYIQEYECFLREMKVSFSDENSIKADFLHVFNKSNFYDYVKRSLSFIGRDDILNNI